MDILDIIVLIFALLWVGIGLLMKKYPELISGYNTMSETKRKNVDIRAVGNLMYKGFLWIAAAIIVLYFTFKLSGMPVAALIGWLAPIFIGTPILLVMSLKYDKNPRSRFMKYLPAGICTLLCMVIFAGIAISIVRDARPTRAIIENNSVEFMGAYGLIVPLDEIYKCELWGEIPRIIARTKGLGLGNIRRGDFRLEGLGKCRLFIEYGNTPYLYIETTKGRKIIFNAPDPAKTETLFENLRPEPHAE